MRKSENIVWGSEVLLKSQAGNSAAARPNLKQSNYKLGHGLICYLKNHPISLL